jgi:hypothetical protein
MGNSRRVGEGRGESPSATRAAGGIAESWKPSEVRDCNLPVNAIRNRISACLDRNAFPVD